MVSFIFSSSFNRYIKLDIKHLKLKVNPLKNNTFAAVISLPLTCLSFFTLSQDDPRDALTIDRTVIASSQLQFPNDERIYPKSSDFSVLNYVLMSSENGERWATVTLKNEADGRRKFDSSQIMALFANGVRAKPEHTSYVFDAEQAVTISLAFGKSKFPLLEVYTRLK